MIRALDTLNFGPKKEKETMKQKFSILILNWPGLVLFLETRTQLVFADPYVIQEQIAYRTCTREVQNNCSIVRNMRQKNSSINAVTV